MLELDGELVRLDEARLGVSPGPSLDVVIGDARLSLGRQQSRSYDVIIGDAFGHLAVPWHLTTKEFVDDVRRVLRPDGVYALNVIDYPPDRLIRAEVATIQLAFRYVALIAPPEALAGRAGSNFVVLASNSPLPLDRLRPLIAGLPRLASVLDGQALSDFRGDARPLTDDYAPVDQLLQRP